jgi:hypothetical protein
MRACPQRAHAAGPFLRAAREGAGADGLSVAAHSERGRSAAGVHEIEILVAVACASPGADMMRACKSRRGREARKSWRGCDARKSRRGCEKHTWQGRLVGSSAHRRPASVCLVARCVVASKEGNRRCPKVLLLIFARRAGAAPVVSWSADGVVSPSFIAAILCSAHALPNAGAGARYSGVLRILGHCRSRLGTYGQGSGYTQ